jgi:hypothetical protein
MIGYHKLLIVNTTNLIGPGITLAALERNLGRCQCLRPGVPPSGTPHGMDCRGSNRTAGGDEVGGGAIFF